jgi:hypothetical protein
MASRALPSAEELDQLYNRCLAVTLPDEQLQAALNHCRQLACLTTPGSFAAKERLIPFSVGESDTAKSLAKQDKKKLTKKEKKQLKKDQKKAKKEQKKREKDLKKGKKDHKHDKVKLEDLEYMTPHLITQRLHAIRDLLGQRSASVSRFAPCLMLFGTSFSADSQCYLLKKASSHALRSENCWQKYLAEMEECSQQRGLEYCYKLLRPQERTCAEHAMRSHWELRKLKKQSTSGKEQEIV